MDFKVWIVLSEKRVQAAVEAWVISSKTEDHSRRWREIRIICRFVLGRLADHEAEVLAHQNRLQSEQRQ